MEAEDIVGQDIGGPEPVKHVGRAIPSQPKRPKVSQALRSANGGEGMVNDGQ